MSRPTEEEVDEGLEVFEKQVDLGLSSTQVMGRVLAAEVRALREDINSGEYFRLKKENAELKASLAALQSDYNAYAVLAKSVRDGLDGELAALRAEVDGISQLYNSHSCMKEVEQLKADLKRAREALEGRREELAELCHEQWSGWTKYLLGKMVAHDDKPGVLQLGNWYIERWKRQINTAFAELPDEEKESDRKEADRFIALLSAPPKAQEGGGEN